MKLELITRPDEFNTDNPEEMYILSIGAIDSSGD